MRSRTRLSEEEIAEVAFELSIYGCLDRLENVVRELERRGEARVLCNGEKLVFRKREEP